MVLMALNKLFALHKHSTATTTRVKHSAFVRLQHFYQQFYYAARWNVCAKRKSEISTGPDKKVYHLIQIDEQTLTVDPWPFQEESFSIYFEFRLIPQIQFENSSSFRQAFIDAEVKEIIWKVVKQKIAPTVRKVKS
jgi:hypothetical protein